MKIIAMMLCRRDAWALGFSARIALLWADELVLLLHDPDEESAAVAAALQREYPRRVAASIEPDGLWWDEMQHRQLMLQMARGNGGTHLAIVDADEFLTGNLLPTIRQTILSTPQGALLQLPGYNLRGGLRKYHSNGVWGNRLFSFAFVDHHRLHWGGDRFHKREPQGLALQSWRPVRHRDGGVLHLWGASEVRLHEKHRWYRIMERLRWPDKPAAVIEADYSLAEEGRPGNAAYGTPITWRYAETPDEWWTGLEAYLPHLHIDAEPWQRGWCEQQIAKYGRAHFAGLKI